MASLNRHRLGRTGIRLTKSSHEAREQNRGKYNYSNREQVALRQKTRVPFFDFRQKTRVPFFFDFLVVGIFAWSVAGMGGYT
jgi:hypothetical protein